MFRKEFLEKALASKDQRQQLDHLLRVTAPHERLLLAGIGVLLLALAVWAFFGSITLGLTMEGVLIEPGDRYEVMAAMSGSGVSLPATWDAAPDLGRDFGSGPAPRQAYRGARTPSAVAELCPQVGCVR